MMKNSNIKLYIVIFIQISFQSVISSEDNTLPKSILDRVEKMMNNKSSYLDISLELRNRGLLFSSATYLKAHLVSIKNVNTISTQDKNKIEALMRYHIQAIGATTFKVMPPEVIQRFTFSPSIKYIRSIQLYEREQYKHIPKILQSINDGHPLSVEARYMSGTSFQLENRPQNAIKEYQRCIKTSKNNSEGSRRIEQKRYYTVLKEKCIMNIARIHYAKKDYKKAIKFYDKIPKTSYRWPYTLLEKAWSYYHLEDYNRSLGILVTYKSPLLSSYFLPESEVLRALNYHSLCLWKDTETIINQYYNVYHQKSKNLKNILTSNNKVDFFFLKLVTTESTKNGKRNIFIENLKTQIQKEIKFNFENNNYRRGVAEIKKIRSQPRSEIRNILLSEVQAHLRLRVKYLNHYIEKKMYSFINEIHRYSYEMFNIRLEIMGNKRNLLYENQELISDRSRGSFSNVRRKNNEHFFDFRGEFWADELGDYSFGLKSNCKKVDVSYVN